MTPCVYSPCLYCAPQCLPIDTPEAHAEHAQIIKELHQSGLEREPLPLVKERA